MENIAQIKNELDAFKQMTGIEPRLFGKIFSIQALIPPPDFNQIFLSEFIDRIRDGKIKDPGNVLLVILYNDDNGAREYQIGNLNGKPSVTILSQFHIDETIEIVLKRMDGRGSKKFTNTNIQVVLQILDYIK